MLVTLRQLFSAEEDETDLADNFIVKTCQKFIPVTGKVSIQYFVSISTNMV